MKTEKTIFDLLDKLIESWVKLEPLITQSRISIEEKYEKDHNITRIIDETYETFASYSTDNLLDYRQKGKDYSVQYTFLFGDIVNEKYMFFPDTFDRYYRYPIIEILKEMKEDYYNREVLLKKDSKLNIDYKILVNDFIERRKTKKFFITKEEVEFLKEMMNPENYKENYISNYKEMTISYKKKKFQELYSRLRIDNTTMVNYGKLGFHVIALKKEKKDLPKLNFKKVHTIFLSDEVHIRLIPRLNEYSIKDVDTFIEKAKSKKVIIERVTSYLKFHNLRQYSIDTEESWTIPKEKCWTKFSKEQNIWHKSIMKSSWNMKQHQKPVLRENEMKFQRTWHEVISITNIFQRTTNVKRIQKELAEYNLKGEQIAKIRKYLKENRIFAAIPKYSQRLGLTIRKGYYIEYNLKKEQNILTKLATNYSSYGILYFIKNNSLVLVVSFPNEKWAKKFDEELRTIKNTIIIELSVPKIKMGRLRDTFGPEELCKDSRDIKNFGKMIRHFKYDENLWWD